MWLFTWEPSKGSLRPSAPHAHPCPARCARPRQTLPRWSAAGKAGRLPTRNPAFLRRAWLAALPLWACACVVPLAPQFEDPAGNYPPYVISSSPPAGAELPAPAQSPTSADTIEVTLGDPNLEDILVCRWIIDYPPYDGFLSRVAQEVTLPTTGAVKREPIRFAASCADIQTGSGLPSHRVTLSVADRPFLPPEQAPDPNLPLDSTRRRRASWCAQPGSWIWRARRESCGHLEKATMKFDNRPRAS